MNVVIKDVNMPKVCDECWALDETGDYPMCRITGETRGYNFKIDKYKMKKCPLETPFSYFEGKIMEEYYRKEDVLKCFDPVPTKAANTTGMRIPTTSEVQFKVLVLPTRRTHHGKWESLEYIDDDSPNGVVDVVKCSNCNFWENADYNYVKKTYRYCPNCGAMMHGEE